MHLDPQHVDTTRQATIAGFRKYSAAFAADDEGDSVPSAPRASPEPIDSPEGGGVDTTENLLDYGEDFFSEDEDSVDGSHETESTTSRPLVLEIPTADVDCDDDDDDNDDESVSATTGRFSTDYVAKSRELLQELTKKNKKESEELEDMFIDMEQTKSKISQLRISPRDLEELERNTNADETSEHRPSSLSAVNMSVVNMQFDRDKNEFLTEGGTIETFWVEDHVMPGASHVLPMRTNRMRSAPVRGRVEGGQTRKQMSDDAMLLRGQTISFLNAEDISVGKKLRETLPRRSTEPSGSQKALRSDNQAARKKKSDVTPSEGEKKVLLLYASEFAEDMCWDVRFYNVVVHGGVTAIWMLALTVTFSTCCFTYNVQVWRDKTDQVWQAICLTGRNPC